MVVGSQGLSSLGNEKAKELLAAGVIGDLVYAEGFWARHSPEGAWQYNVPADGNEKKRWIGSGTYQIPLQETGIHCGFSDGEITLTMVQACLGTSLYTFFFQLAFHYQFQGTKQGFFNGWIEVLERWERST